MKRAVNEMLGSPRKRLLGLSSRQTRWENHGQSSTLHGIRGPRETLDREATSPGRTRKTVWDIHRVHTGKRRAGLSRGPPAYGGETLKH